MKRKLLVGAFLLSLAVCCFAQQSEPEPIIDMHLHAFKADVFGPPPQRICVPLDFSGWDPKQRGSTIADLAAGNVRCAKPLVSPLKDEELMNQTLAVLKRFNITAVAGGPPEIVDRWKRAGGDAIIPATGFLPGGASPSEIRKWIQEGRISALAEVLTQYEGIAPNAESLEPYFALAEELDIPVGIHMGPGPPGAPYLGSKGYRMRLSSLLLLEDVLVRHPNLRVWAMHAGWPLAEDAIAALYAHPQLYVDIGAIDYGWPREEFYSYLRRLIKAGFENRIMFGSDQMIWPDAIPIAVETIRSAPFLTEEQKRDILYNNAARFLRLKKGPTTRAAEPTKQITANGYTFTYVEAGKGEPVILVHGALGDYRSQESLAQRLATRFHVIRYSRRYHYPDKPAAISDYTPEVHARDLVAFIRALHLGPVHLVGRSYGGLVAMLAAASAPDLISTLTLPEPALFSVIAGSDAMEQRQKEQAAVVADIRRQFSAGHPNLAVDEFFEWIRGNDGRFRSAPIERRQKIYDNEATLLPMFAGSGLAIKFNCEDAQKFTRPSLLLYGDHTRIWYRAVVMRLSKCMPNAEVSEILNSTHFHEDDNPAQTDEVILKYLQAHSGK